MYGTLKQVMKNCQLFVEKQNLKSMNRIHVYTWTTAIIKYMCILLQDFLGKAQEMLKYMHKYIYVCVCDDFYLIQQNMHLFPFINATAHNLSTIYYIKKNDFENRLKISR